MPIQYDYDLSDYLVTITGAGITGILQDNSLTLPFGANISQSNFAATFDTKNIMASIGEGVGNFLGVNAISSGIQTYKSSVHSVKEFIKDYENSGDMDISLSVIIVPGVAGMPKNYSSIIQQLSYMTLPKVDGGIMESEMVDDLTPLATNWKALDGQLCGISIGNWFHTEQIFWCTSASASLSTVIDTNGNPSYMTINFSFTPYRPVTKDDVMKWIG